MPQTYPFAKTASVKTHKKQNYISLEEEQNLAQQYFNHNDLNAAKQLVISHLNVVERIAKGFNGYGLPFEDLVQEGTIGLMNAVRRFDPNKGFRLITFAMHWIRSAIHNFVLNNAQIVKLGTTKSQRKLFFNKGRWRSLENTSLSSESLASVAKEYDVSEQDVITMEKRLYAGDLSLNGPGKGTDDDSGKDSLQDQLPSNTDPADIVLQSEHQGWVSKQLKQSLSTLNDREQIILEKRLLCDKKTPLAQLGKRFGISTERVRQLEKRALNDLRQSMSMTME